MARRGGLGRGLAALIPPGEASDDVRASMAEIPVDAVVPNPRQPREVFDDEELEGLAVSLRDLGLLQPIVVRPVEGDRYELIAGERRLRAARLAGLAVLPAVVRHTEDADLLKEALVENIHRVQLNPLEEAAAYQQLLEDFGFTQEELATKLGRSRPSVTNAIRLLGLPPGVQRRVAAGVLTAGHAKALLAIPDPAVQERLADRIVREGMSVRATEELVRLRLVDDETAPVSRTTRRKVVAPGLVELQDDLSDALMARVRISMGPRKGRLQIDFSSADDLERIVGVIANGLEGATTPPSMAPGALGETVADRGTSSGLAGEPPSATALATGDALDARLDELDAELDVELGDLGDVGPAPSDPARGGDRADADQPERD
jgi:ParB family transcriptional regulator, chromosome partitioning protein